MRHFFIVLAPATVSCGEAGTYTDTGAHTSPPPYETEVITRVTFEVVGADASAFAWVQSDEGTATVDTVRLGSGGSYSVLLRFEDPPHDLTLELFEEAAEHQVFVLGTAVDGPANPDNASAVVEHFYGDTDKNGLPVGLANGFYAASSGSGTLRIVLQHLGTSEGGSLKVADLADLVAREGLEALPGVADIDIEFPVTVE